MKILFDTKIFELQIFGGISLYFTKLFEEFLKDKDIEYTIPYVYSDNYYVKDKPYSPPFTLYQNPFLFKKQAIKALTELNKLNVNRKILMNNFDVFHPTYFNGNFVKNLKKPYVLTVHDMTVEAVTEHFIFDKQLKQTIETKKHLIEKASRIIAISNNTKQDIMNYCKVNESKIDVIYHGLPLNNVKIIEKIDDLPEKYILFIGQRAKYKNFANLITSIKDLLLQDENLYLVIAGGGETNKSEREFIEKLGISHKIIKKPIQNNSQLINYYKNALCFVFPSVYEGFGFPILEAFQCGCPLICSNTSCFTEIADDSAMYIDPYSEKSMKDAIQKTVYDNNLRTTLINKGYERIKDFSWDKTAELTKDTYKKTLC